MRPGIMRPPNLRSAAVTLSPESAVDAVVARIKANADRWVAVSISERVLYLERCMEALATVAPAWAAATARNRGLDPSGEDTGEAWLSELMPTMRSLRLLAVALRAGGQPPPPLVATRSGDQKVVRVYPTDLMDKLLFTGVTADVWIQPGMPASQGQLYRDKAAGRTKKGAVSLVLGAGNVGSICPTDAIYKLFVEDEVVVVKTNPVNAYLTPYWEACLKPLVDDGFIAFVDGGPEVGVALTEHPDIESIHITGSDKTYDAIVWGTGPDVAARKAAGQKRNSRPVSAELGCITPVIVVPGQWSKKELAYQAKAVAIMVTNNASFNCTAGKVLITHAGWPQRQEFLDALRAAFRGSPRRKAYYPGSFERYDRFLAAYPSAEVVGVREDGCVPWTLIPGLSADAAGEVAFQQEAWCGVLADTALGASDAGDFMRKATTFANERLWGTLSANIIVDPRTRKSFSSAYDSMLADLQYGGIAVNIWSGAIFGLASPPWGAYPGHTAADIQSGAGTVHNTYLLDHPQKTVLEAPFTIFPPPAWFDGHRGAREVGERMVAMEGRRSWTALPGLVRHALRGGS